MTSRPTELRTAFVEAYPAYVAGALRDRRIDVDEVVADAIVEGAAVLDGLLTTLERQDAIEQRRSPLELFREALRPVVRALELRGVEPTRGGGEAAWDRYGLAPGSSQVLGPRAHEAHLAWGVAKAKVMAPLVLRPKARVVAPDEARPELVAAVESAGYVVVDADGPTASVAVVDVGHPRARSLIAEFGRDSVHVVAIGDDVDDLSTPGLRALGAAAVVRRTVFVDAPGDHLPAPA